MSYIRLERFSDFYPDVPLDGRRKRLPEHLLKCLGIRMNIRHHCISHVPTPFLMDILPFSARTHGSSTNHRAGDRRIKPPCSLTTGTLMLGMRHDAPPYL